MIDREELLAARSGPARAPVLAGALLAAGFVTAPMTAVAPFGVRMRVSDAAFAAAFVLVIVGHTRDDVPRVRLDDVARRLLVGAAAILAAVAFAELLREGTDPRFETLVLQVGAAALPVVLLTAPWADEPVRRNLVRAYIAGVLASVAVGFASPRLPSGRIEGLTLHPNQLAMSCVIAIGLLPCALTLRRPGGVAVALGTVALLLAGLYASGSRSGALALVATIGLTMWQLARSDLARVLAVLAAAMVALVVVVGGDVSERSLPTESLGTLVGRDDADASDEQRRAVLAESLERLDVTVLLRGSGLDFDRLPHNVFIEVLVAGGSTALAGLLLIVSVPVRLAIRADTAIASVRRCSSAAVMGFFVAAFFGNALWAPFAWCALALLGGPLPPRRQQRSSIST